MQEKNTQLRFNLSESITDFIHWDILIHINAISILKALDSMLHIFFHSSANINAILSRTRKMESSSFPYRLQTYNHFGNDFLFSWKMKRRSELFPYAENCGDTQTIGHKNTSIPRMKKFRFWTLASTNKLVINRR